MTYLAALAEEIRREVARDALPDEDTSALFLAYAVLALAKGADVTREDVHNAWVAWMASKGEQHDSMRPFAELPPDTQAEDSPFVIAIRNVARRQGAVVGGTSIGPTSTSWGSGSPLVDALDAYRDARRSFLEKVGCRPDSMRDPLAEFAELLVAALTGDRLADSPVQKGWDLMAEDGKTTQVRYVANPRGRWVNGHEVRFEPGVDQYALVLYEALEPTAVLIFSNFRLGDVCRVLGKRHGNQDRTLQLTPDNIRRLRNERAEFAPLGVRVFPEMPR